MENLTEFDFVPSVEIKKIAQRIHALPPEEVDTEGARLIQWYVDVTRDCFRSIDITNNLELFLSLKVKGFWKKRGPAENEYWCVNEPNQGGLQVAFMGIMVERLFRGKSNVDPITEGEYQFFADKINRAADLGIIEGGALCVPFRMEMAVISPSYRTLCCFNPMTRLTLKQLKCYSNIFIGEGEVGPRIKDIWCVAM